MLPDSLIKRFLLLFSVLAFFCMQTQAQVINNTLDPTSQQNSMFNQGKDSSILKQKEEWKEEHARIYYNTLNSAVAKYPDTTLENFHRYQSVQPWWGKDLGNSGSAVRNQFFTPVVPMGLSLGYHIYDMYRLTLDSLRFYNTTRPYSAFSFMLGSKSEQNVEIIHTQNITPQWNFSTQLRYYSSAGFYKTQKTSSISGTVTSNYQSKNKRYYLATGFVYNRHKQDENGGIIYDTLLSNSSFSDRQLIGVNIPNSPRSTTNSAVTNQLRDLDFYLQNNYSFGKTDTVYTKDSTGVSYNFTPRFRIKHQLQLHSERHIYKDLDPDSPRYAFIKPITFGSLDTVYNAQNWFYVDNKFSLNGFLGKSSELVQIEAGVGNRVDRFNTNYISGTDGISSVGNYVFGEIKKEAFKEGQWNYQASANLFFTGDATGNFDVSAYASKSLRNIGKFSAGIRQNLSNAPYAYTSFRTQFYDRSYAFDKMSMTQVWAKVGIDKIGLQLGIKNNLIANYLYFDQNQAPKQQSEAFSILQITGRKEFRFGIFYLDNEVAWQQTTGNAPVHVPAFLLRHKLGLITPLFKSALIVAAGVEARYHTPYYSDGYSPYFNQFYYQDKDKISNVPETQVYFNFKVKSFRAFVIFDELQQYFSTNIKNAPGYYAQNAMFKFGFTWILIN